MPKYKWGPGIEKSKFTFASVIIICVMFWTYSKLAEQNHDKFKQKELYKRCPSYLQVSGAVNKPGIVCGQKGETWMLDAIHSAGGLAGCQLAKGEEENATPLKSGDHLEVFQRQGWCILIKRRMDPSRLLLFGLKADINLIDENDMMMIPDLPMKVKKNILDYRNQHGPFEDINDLDNIEGIGLGRLKILKLYLTVED